MHHQQPQTKDKIIVTRINFSPVDKNMLTVSGLQTLKSWSVGADNSMNAKNLLPPNKSQENFIDHAWMIEKGSPIRRMVAITDGPSHMGPAEDREYLIYVFEAVESGLEMRRVINAALPVNARAETIYAFGKGFIVAGSHGFFSLYDRTDDRKDPYLLIKTLKMEGKSFHSLTATPNDELLVAFTRDRNLYSFPLGSIDIMEEGDNNFTELSTRGFHSGKVLAMDLCLQKPFLVTCCEDQTIRVWNYLTWHCDISQTFTEEPSAVAMHPSGTQLIAGFKDRIRVFNLLHGELRLFFEIAVNKCRYLAYSHGGHQFAVASGINVFIYSAYNYEQLHNLASHTGAVKHICWAADDLSVFSAGQDGCSFGWDLNKGRIDDVGQMNNPAAFSSIAVDIPKSQKGKTAVSTIVGVTVGGQIREVTWRQGQTGTEQLRSSLPIGGKESEAQNLLNQGYGSALTAMVLTHNRKFLVAGTDKGSIHVFNWPLDQNFGMGVEQKQPPRAEFQVHDGAVTAIAISHDDRYLFTGAKDGTVFVSRLLTGSGAPLGVSLLDANAAAAAAPAGSGLEAPSGAALFNIDVVQVSLEEPEERRREVDEMRKKLEEMKNDNDFAIRRKEMDMETEIKRMMEDREEQVQAEQVRYNQLSITHDDFKQRHFAEMQRANENHGKVTQELENQYEFKLATEMERYDRLSEEIEAIQQRCAGLLDAQAEEHREKMHKHEAHSKKNEKDLKLQIEKLLEDAKHNE